MRQFLFTIFSLKASVVHFDLVIRDRSKAGANCKAVNHAFKVMQAMPCAPAMPRNAAACSAAGLGAAGSGGNEWRRIFVVNYNAHCIIYKLWTGSFSNRGGLLLYWQRFLGLRLLQSVTFRV